MSTRLGSMDLMTARKARPLLQLFAKSCTATPNLEQDPDRDHCTSASSSRLRSGAHVHIPTHLRVRFCTHCSSFLMALLCSRMAADVERCCSEATLQKDASDSKLVGMEDRLQEDGNWLRMFPVSSLI